MCSAGRSLCLGTKPAPSLNPCWAECLTLGILLTSFRHDTIAVGVCANCCSAGNGKSARQLIWEWRKRTLGCCPVLDFMVRQTQL